MKKKLESLEDLLVDTLKDIYSAESQLLKALPEMADAAFIFLFYFWYRAAFLRVLATNPKIFR